MDTGKALIDRAVQMCGGEAELAHRLGVQRQLVHGWHRGHRAITPETVALLGDVLELPGEEVQRLAAWAVIENAKNAGKRERLKRAFFGCWVLGVAGALLTAAPTEAQAKKTNVECRMTLYTLSLVMRGAFLALVRSLWERLAQAKAAPILAPLARPQRLKAAGCGL